MPQNTTNYYDVLTQWNKTFDTDGEMDTRRYHGQIGGYRNPQIVISFAHLLKKYADLYGYSKESPIGLVCPPISGLIYGVSASTLFPETFRIFVSYEYARRVKDIDCKYDHTDGKKPNVKWEKLRLQQIEAKTFKHLWFIDDDICTGRTCKQAIRLFKNISKAVVWLNDSWYSNYDTPINIEIVSLRDEFLS